MLTITLSNSVQCLKTIALNEAPQPTEFETPYLHACGSCDRVVQNLLEDPEERDLEEQRDLLTVPGDAVKHLDDAVTGESGVIAIVAQEFDVAADDIGMAKSGEEILFLKTEKLYNPCTLF